LDRERENFSAAELFGRPIIPCIHRKVKRNDLKRWSLGARIIETLYIEKFDDLSSLLLALDK